MMYYNITIMISPDVHANEHGHGCALANYTVNSGYQAHALVGTIAKIYALHNEVRYITGVKG